MSKVVNIAAIRGDKERREDPSRWGNQALVTPAIGDDQNEKCFNPDCKFFADYDVTGAAEMHGLTCRFHLDDYIHRFFGSDYAKKPRGRPTYSQVGTNPEWKEWQRVQWRLEYQRAIDAKRSRRDFPTRPTKRQAKKEERAAYKRAMTGE